MIIAELIDYMEHYPEDKCNSQINLIAYRRTRVVYTSANAGIIYKKRKEENEVIYQTFHGTKGLEFKNVVIVLEDGFGAQKEDKVFLKSFLEDYLALETQQQVIKHEKARNLLYVAVTRAIENLKVIYLGNSERAEKTLDYIFNQKEK